VTDTPEERAEVLMDAIRRADAATRRTCEMVVGWRVTEDGDPGDEILCGGPAVALMISSPVCALCIARNVGHDEDLARDVRPMGGGAA